MVMNKRRGRPSRGAPAGRDRLLEAGASLFAEHGYQGTTLRMLAEAADCDPALIAYHFGSKRGLFAQVAAVLLSPAEVVERAYSDTPPFLHPVAERSALAVLLKLLGEGRMRERVVILVAVVAIEVALLRHVQVRGPRFRVENPDSLLEVLEHSLPYRRRG